LLARCESIWLRGSPQALRPSGTPALSSRAEALTESASPDRECRAPAKQKKQRESPQRGISSASKACSTRQNSFSSYDHAPVLRASLRRCTLFCRDHSTWMEELSDPPGRAEQADFPRVAHLMCNLAVGFCQALTRRIGGSPEGTSDVPKGLGLGKIAQVD
jgi:hypothetical protein